MPYEFISDTTKTLMEQHRVKEAIGFCERVIEEHPDRERKAIAYHDLAEIHFFLAGNGVASREANIAGLELLDSDLEKLVFNPEKAPSSIMKRIYSDFCEQIRTIAISYDEYEKYAGKTEGAGIRPKNAQEKRGIDVCKTNMANNAPWAEDLFNKVADYARHQACGQMASTLSVVIANRKQMRISGQDLNSHVLPGYGKAVIGLVIDHINFRGAKAWQTDMDDFAFIFDTARELIRECENDRNADPNVIEEVLAMLDREQAGLEAQLSSRRGGKPPRPSSAEIDAGFKKCLTETPFVRLREDDGSPQKERRQAPTKQFRRAPGVPQSSGIPQPPGCSVAIIIASVAVSIALWWWAVGTGEAKWYAVVLAVIATIFTLAPLPLHIKNISSKKK